MRTCPIQRSLGDASQRSPAWGSRLGAAAAGGDASQRSPIGRSPLGLGLLGGDASRRGALESVNWRMERGYKPSCRLPKSSAFGDASQRTPLGSVPSDHSMSTPQGAWCSFSWAAAAASIAATSEAAAASADATQQSPSGDSLLCKRTAPFEIATANAFQRRPSDPAAASLNVDECSHVVKSWLSGENSDPLDLAEQLRAAAPETYED